MSPEFASGLGSAAGDLAGSVVSGLFGRSSAKKAMKFEENMSNTAYQRAATDLEKAGLNRILALGSPASTPNAPMPSIDSPKLGSSFQAGSSAKAQRRVQAETELLLREQQGKTRQETAAAAAQEKETLSRIDLNAANATNARAQAAAATLNSQHGELWKELQHTGAEGFRWIKNWLKKQADDQEKSWLPEFSLPDFFSSPNQPSSARGAPRTNPPHKTRPNIKGGPKRGSR